jgi:hypothetical protein
MAVTTSTTHAREPATRSTPAASKGVAGTASERAVPTEEATAEAGSDMLQTISRMIYSGSYALAYGVVYAAVFMSQSLPRDNPVMHGLRDGGRAAMDQLEDG